MTATGLHHVNVRASAALIEALRSFYMDVIGLTEGPRPAFSSPGHWLYAGGRDVLHLTVDALAIDTGRQPTGHLNHIALACTGLSSMRDRLASRGIPYEIDVVPDLGQIQLFLEDPAGLCIELNYSEPHA